MSQYALDLALPPVFSAGNFFVSGCNRDAFAWIERWPDWKSPALMLYGPTGSGKSHLGHIWMERASASLVNASELDKQPQPGHWLIEDIEQVKEQCQLLHWFNYIRETGGNLLLTSRFSAKELPFTLPDLTSRLRALPTVAIEQADDEVLAGALRKQFADRQVKVDGEVITYLLPRMERSLAKAKELVDRLDTKALEQGRNITVPFVRSVFNDFNRVED